MTEKQIAKAACLWLAGRDTHQIAKRLRLKEHEVASRLGRIRALAKKFTGARQFYRDLWIGEVA